MPQFLPANATPAEVREFHKRADTDTDITSAHHTLGSGRTQASPGNHVHDGKLCNKIGAGMGIVISGAKGGNAALTSTLAALALVMEFTDTTT